MRALQEGDVGDLRRMYANFLRDPCSTGLAGVPYGLADKYFRGPIPEVYCHSYLGDALYRIDYWISQTGGRYELADLAGPVIGNPFGVLIDGTLVRAGSEYQHYCAFRILSLLKTRPSVVGEIGGGYGGMAYYLLRDGIGVKYIDFDVPESIALTSFYLLKAFPSSKVLLYGEKELTAETLAGSDIALLPIFEISTIPAGTLNLTFSSHTMGDLSDDAMAKYLDNISRITREHLLYLGDGRAADRLARLGSERLSLLEGRFTGWNRHKAPRASEGEYLYQLRHN